MKMPIYYVQQSVPNFQVVKRDFGVVAEFKSKREAVKYMKSMLKLTRLY